MPVACDPRLLSQIWLDFEMSRVAQVSLTSSGELQVSERILLNLATKLNIMTIIGRKPAHRRALSGTTRCPVKRIRMDPGSTLPSLRRGHIQRRNAPGRK